ncbi:MAG: DNA polymerase III subunit [Clostridia bacterium]|nr:DNA polymerase III subunit [Clostridia bacterium]
MMFPLAGNEKIKTALGNAIKENRIPHAIIIEGDSGLGKHTLTKFIAKAAVCDVEDAPCGVCKNCHLADISSHPDISVTAPEDGKKNISVAQIRSLRNETFVKPHMAKRRVFIIDFADTMNEQSQNALLKVLEEPPADIIFILIAESKAALLETIISRCVVLTLSAPELSQAVDFIGQKGNYSHSEIAEALRETACNIGKALALLSGESDTKTSAAAKEFIECMLRCDEFGCLKCCAPFEKKRVEADRFLKDLKYNTVLKIKKNTGKPQAKALARFYSGLSLYEKSLATNINLSLLFCALSAEATKIMK